LSSRALLALSGRKPTIERMDPRRRVATLGVAVGGVLTGHWLTYEVVSLGGHTRTTLLRVTGHAYLSFANDLALILALSAFAALFVGQLSAANGTGRAVGITRRVVAFQVSAFVLMEVLERVTAGAPLGELIRTGVLPVGVATQAVVALVAAASIRWMLRVADRVAAVLSRPAVPTRAVAAAHPLPQPVFRAVRRHLSAAGVRGPPLSV
jgi:hypothetical protein